MNNVLTKIILIVCVLTLRGYAEPIAPSEILKLSGRILEGDAMPYIKLPENTNEAPDAEPLVAAAMRNAGLNIKNLAFSQLILVYASGSEAVVTALEKDAAGAWVFCEELNPITGYVGRNGVSFDKTEGDGCTPGGLFAIGYAFGNNEMPETGLDYRKVTGQSYWIDDMNSAYYNQWVEGEENKDWHSAERLSDSKNAYAYAAVIEYNTGQEKIAGKGSAIFLHCGTEPTSGCVAVTKRDMLMLLKWLKSAASSGEPPHILIVSEPIQ